MIKFWFLKHPVTKLFFATLFWLAVSKLFLMSVGFYGGSRPTNPALSCQANLKQFQAAKEQWAMEHPKLWIAGIDPKLPDLVPAYIKTAPHCPMGGSYILGDRTHRPRCSVHGVVPDY